MVSTSERFWNLSTIAILHANGSEAVEFNFKNCENLKKEHFFRIYNILKVFIISKTKSKKHKHD